MTDKLSIYNGALAVLGATQLANLNENRRARRELDGVWSRGGILECLEMAQWRFAIKTVQLDYSPSVEPDFGLRYAFDRPTDFRRLCAISADEYFVAPLDHYTAEGEFFYADVETIYLRYVSDDSDYGLNYSRWPQAFRSFVEHFVAEKVCIAITGDAEKQKSIQMKLNGLLSIAAGNDAMEEPAQRPPAGTWSRARRFGRADRDRGSRNQLIG